MNQELQLIRLPAVIAKVRFQKTKIWNMMKEGTFPKGFNITKGIRVWEASEIDDWITEQIARAKAGA